MSRTKKNVAIQADPITGLNRASDSTLMLAEEAQKRGYGLYWYMPQDLSLRDGVPIATARPFRFVDSEVWYELGPATSLPLPEVNVVLMRQDPPFNLSYITATYMLERLPSKTKVINHPTAVRNNPEKLLPLYFPDFLPPTLVSARAEDLRAFHREFGTIVIKPLYGYGGHAVFHIGPDGANLDSLLETLLIGREPLVAQRFLPEVNTGERRVVLISGEVAGTFARLPAEGDIRANMRVGGTPAKATLTHRQMEICQQVGMVLKAKGLLLAGLDFIGDWLIEINITSPTGLRALEKLYGTKPASMFWNVVEGM